MNLFFGIPSKRNAVIMTVIITVIWSSSWILIKIGLEEIPALPFAGIRYIMAFIFMLPWMMRKDTISSIRGLTGKDWWLLAFLGLLTYPLNQGGLFLAMSYLPNATVSLIGNFTPVLLAVLGGIFLKEILNRWQFVGMVATVIGALVFFLPITGDPSGIGFVCAFIMLFANAIGAIVTRKILKSGAIPVLVVTALPMGIGSVLLGVGSGFWEWIPRISLSLWGILLFLSLINTTIAFTVWNIALQRLTALEANLISNTMLVQIAILSWIFLGDAITWKMAAGMALVIGGVILVNLRGEG